MLALACGLRNARAGRLVPAPAVAGARPNLGAALGFDLERHLTRESVYSKWGNDGLRVHMAGPEEVRDVQAHTGSS